MFLSSGMWWSARTTCWSSLGRSSSSWSSPSPSSGTCGMFAVSCSVRISSLPSSLSSWSQYLQIRHREPSGLVRSPQISRLLQNLQCPDPHNEGDPGRRHHDHNHHHILQHVTKITIILISGSCAKHAPIPHLRISSLHWLRLRWMGKLVFLGLDDILFPNQNVCIKRQTHIIIISRWSLVLTTSSSPPWWAPANVFSGLAIKRLKTKNIPSLINGDDMFATFNSIPMERALPVWVYRFYI